MLLVHVDIIPTIISENRHLGKSLAYILVLVFLSVIGWSYIMCRVQAGIYKDGV